MSSVPSSPVFEVIDVEAAGMPLYRLVKQALLSAIESGRCAAGKALPSESEIAGSMGVSIGTLRRAVTELAAEHILVRRQGRGTFVATHSADRSMFQFFRVERNDGVRVAPTVDMVSFERRRAEGEPANALRLPAGEPVFQIENRLQLQGNAVIYDRLTLACTLFGGLTEKTFRERPGTIYQLYQSSFGISVLSARERGRAAAADDDAVRVLGLSKGQPVMEVRRTALTFGDRPVEHRVSIIDTTHHDYVNLLSRPVAD